MTRVAISPWYKAPDKGDGGIRRVVEAQKTYLPALGIQPVENPDEADVIACHALDLVTRPGVPMVAHNHGLYWSGIDWPRWAHEGNKKVANMLAHAVRHTAPSRWVANALRRGMLVYPEIIHHGVDPEAWKPAPNGPGNYVLWNKARADAVSNPRDMNRLAAKTPEIPFVATFGQNAANVTTIGRTPFRDMRKIIEAAGVFLVTARETFGIGTLEAMAAGVPIVGWNYGGQADIVQQGITGILVTPGDYDALAEALRIVYRDRGEMGAAARSDVKNRWTWPARIRQYARIYEETAQIYQTPRPKVSIVVTAYNLAGLLEETLESVLAQTFEDWECLIVDDCSRDDTALVGLLWSEKDPRFRYLKTPENLGLCGARNFGFEHARGQYFLPLDADDLLAPNALDLMATGLDQSWGIHIAYGHLVLMGEDGGDRRRGSWPFPQYSWHGQLAHLNQLPYCSMMRREVMEASGGYRLRAWRAEDAEFWCRVTSLGFRARKVTQEPTLFYRLRSDSKSRQEGGDDGDWTAWYPWRLGDARVKGAVAKKHVKEQTVPDPDLVPFGAQGRPPKRLTFWHVHDFDRPAVSVVIPVGPGHERYVIDALDSLVAQTFQNWEAIVVNDTGQTWPRGFKSPLAGAPYARVMTTAVDSKNPPKIGTGAARNLGAKAARGAALLFLDADDILLPAALASMVQTFAETGGLVYTDWFKSWGDPGKPLERFEAVDFSCPQILDKMGHLMTCLVPASAHREIGGFNEDLAGWEDWDYLIRIHAEAGVCGYRVTEPLVVYRFTTGDRRDRSASENKPALIDHLRTRFRKYYKQEAPMGCRKCPDKAKSQRKVFAIRRGFRDRQSGVLSPRTNGDSEMIKIRFNHPNTGTMAFRGKGTGHRYRFKTGKEYYVYEADYEHFKTMKAQGQSIFVQVTDQPEPELEVAHVEPPPDAANLAEYPEPAGPLPELKAELAPPDIVDPGTLTISKLKGHLAGLDEAELLATLEAEEAGQNRKGALEAIREALAVVEV